MQSSADDQDDEAVIIQSSLPPKKRRPTCARCRNHGLISDIKGHKRVCEYATCQCARCKLVTQRRQVMARQVALNREQLRQYGREHHRADEMFNHLPESQRFSGDGDLSEPSTPLRSDATPFEQQQQPASGKMFLPTCTSYQSPADSTVTDADFYNNQYGMWGPSSASASSDTPTPQEYPEAWSNYTTPYQSVVSTDGRTGLETSSQQSSYVIMKQQVSVAKPISPSEVVQYQTGMTSAGSYAERCQYSSPFFGSGPSAAHVRFSGGGMTTGETPGPELPYPPMNICSDQSLIRQRAYFPQTGCTPYPFQQPPSEEISPPDPYSASPVVGQLPPLYSFQNDNLYHSQDIFMARSNEAPFRQPDTAPYPSAGSRLLQKDPSYGVIHRPLPLRVTDSPFQPIQAYTYTTPSTFPFPTFSPFAFGAINSSVALGGIPCPGFCSSTLPTMNYPSPALPTHNSLMSMYQSPSMNAPGTMLYEPPLQNSYFDATPYPSGQGYQSSFAEQSYRISPNYDQDDNSDIIDVCSVDPFTS